MQKSLKIKQFITGRIGQIDAEYQHSQNVMAKLKLSTMRTSFANIMSSYLNDESELGFSYYKHAATYCDAGCYEQAICYSKLAHKHLTSKQEIIEPTNIIILKSLFLLHKIEEAHDLLTSISNYLHYLAPIKLRKQYYEIKVQVLEAMGDEDGTCESLGLLEGIIGEQHSQKSAQMGLFLIQKGKKMGSFKKYNQALTFMNDGMNILMQVKHKNHFQIGKIYLTMASFSRQLLNLDSQYTQLICAHSMIRQSSGKQKQLIDTIHKLAVNLIERGEDQLALGELLKAEVLQKQVYGQSTLMVSKTLKSICELLLRMNRKGQSRKYLKQYNCIMNCNNRSNLSRQKALKSSKIKISA